jgi:hypothetical protein
VHVENDLHARYLASRPIVQKVYKFLNSWVNYDAGYRTAGFYIDSWDAVHCTGLVKSGTANASMYRLPERFRPQPYHVIQIATQDGLAGRMDVNTAGDLIFVSSYNTYCSLDGVVFHPESVEYTAPTLLNSWVNYDTIYDPAGYWQNPQNGMVRLRGLIKNGTTGVSCQAMPVGMRPTERHIFATLAAGVLDRIDVTTGGDVLLVNGSATWTTLGRVNYPVDTSAWTAMSLINSWAIFDTSVGGWAQPRYWRDESGVVNLMGMIKSGASGSVCTVLPAGYRPRSQIIFPSYGGGAYAQIDVRGDGYVFVTGAAVGSWTTLSGLSFLAEA